MAQCRHCSRATLIFVLHHLVTQGSMIIQCRRNLFTS